MKDDKLLYREESYALRSCIFEVSRKLGCGFLEAVYQEALERESVRAAIPFESQKMLCVFYDGEPLRHTYTADFVCYGKIIMEIKSVSQLASNHCAQVRNYLAATGYKLGLLVNFGAYPKAEVRRIVVTEAAGGASVQDWTIGRA